MDYKNQAEQEALARAITEENRQYYLELARIKGIGIVHIFDKYHPFGGLTVAFSRCNPDLKNGVMADVSLAYCSRLDNFSRKEGTHLALHKFFNDDHIQMPLFAHSHIDGDNALVKSIFGQMFFGY